MQFKLIDVVDIDVLKTLFESFFEATGTLTAVLDIEGTVLLAVGWQEICTRFHRAHPDTACRCLESDTQLAGQLESGQEYNVYRCKNGLVDVAVPIMIAGNHVGNLFTGQFFYSPPDKTYFKKQADEFGFDETEYLAALSRVPIFSERQVEKTMGFLSLLANTIGEMGASKLRSDAELAERKRAEKALQASEEQKRLIIETVPDLVWLKDLDGKYLACNKMFERFFGATENQIVGKTDYDFVDSELADFFRKHDRAAMDAGGPLRNEERVTFADDGHEALLETTKTPLKDNQGKVIGVLGIGRDITERDHLSDLLKRAEHFAHFGHWRFTVADQKLELSDEVYRIYGYPSDAPFDTVPDAVSIYHPDDREKVNEYLATAIDTGNDFEFELRLVRPNGEVRNVYAKGECEFDTEGKVFAMFGIIQDITERKRAADHLRESEKKYRSLFDTMRNGFALHEIILDDAGKPCDYRFLEVNPACEGIAGLGRDIVGKTVLEVLPNLETTWIEIYGKVALTGEPASFEDYSVDLDRHFEVYAYSPRKGQFATIFSDITERKQAENALRGSEQKYRALFDTMLNGFVLHEIILDDDGKPCDYRFLEVNPAFETMTGMTRDVIGKTVREILPTIEDEWIDRFGRVALTGESIRFQRYFKPLDRHFEAIAYSPEKGQFANIFSDITERVRAEDALRKNEALLTEMERVAQIGGWEYDPGSELTSWTSETYRIFEISQEQAPPKPDGFLDYCHPDDGPVLHEAFARAIEDGTPFNLEIRCITATGKPFWSKAIGRPVVEDGQCIKIFGSVQDISERKALERQLAQAQKMEAVGQLSGGLAHDLNNVLGIISMNAQMLHGQAADNPNSMKHYDTIMTGIRRGSDLTRKILDFSRTDVGETKYVSVNDFIEGMENLVGKSLTPAISMEAHLAKDVWPVEIDPGDLENAILNLALNAGDALPNGGTLLFETANKVIDQAYVDLNPGSSAGDFVMISVSDTGTGMPPETVEKAFEPFFTTKDVGKGTGLGLSMVYGFVQRSGGHVKIYSELGEGTTIRLYLPRARDVVENAQSRSYNDDGLPGGDETVLVVDDEQDLVDAAVSALESLGYRTITATTGAEALEILRRDLSIDLLFCDVIMPKGMDGYGLALEALKDRPDLKVLLTSGFTSKREQAVNGDRKVASSLTKSMLQKPYNINELAIAVRRALDGGD